VGAPLKQGVIMSVAAVQPLAPVYPIKSSSPAVASAGETTRERVVKKFKAVVLNPDTPLWLGNVGSIARAIEQIVSPFIQTSIKIQKLLSGTQFTAALNAPFNIYEVATGFAKVLKEKGTEVKLDHGLELISNIGQLSEDIGGIASAFKDLKIVTGAFAWLTPLAIFSAITSTVTYIMDGRTIFYCSKLLAKTKAKYANNPEGLLKKHAYHLERQGGIDMDLCKKVLEKVEAAPQPNKEPQTALLKAIRHRVKSRRLCQALNIVVTTISIIVTAIFLLSSAQALLIAGAALIVALSVISMARRGINLYSNHQFEKRLSAINY
jgi:hypothetical protein